MTSDTTDRLLQLAECIRGTDRDGGTEVPIYLEAYLDDADTLERAIKGLELLEWLIHLHCGVGKGGQSPCGSEWEDVLEQALEFCGEPNHPKVVRRR